MTRKRTLYVAALFGFIALIVLFLFGYIFTGAIISDIDVNASVGTSLESTSEIISPVFQSISSAMPVLLWVSLIGLIAVAFIVLFRARMR